MKAEILKIAGVKSEKEFYKKYPTEEAFMKAHGKEFKKAKLGKAMAPDAQDGRTMRAANAEFSCSAHPRSELRSAFGGGGSGEEVKVVPEWAEISNPESGYFDKDQLKQLKKEYNTAKGKYKGLDFNTYVAAARDAARTSSQFANPERAKYFDPATGALMPNVDPRSIDPYMRFYRSKFPTQSKISAEDVLGVYGGMEGGLSNFEKYANVGYQKPMKQGGQLDKLNQLTNFTNDVDDIIPMAQVGTYIPGQGVPQIQNYQPPATTGIGGNMLNMGYGTPQTTIGGMDIASNFLTAGYETPSVKIGDFTVPKNFLSMGYKGIGSKENNPSLLDNLGGPQGIGNIVGGITGAVKGEKSWKEQKKAAKRALDLARLTNRAARTMDEPIRRQYVRPEDVDIQPEQMFPTYGVGTNYLSRNGSIVKAEGGMQIGGNLTEIQNTYAPGTLYDDLGYQPLNNPNQVKQYYGGGEIPTAQGGFDFGSIFSALGGGEQNWASGANTVLGAAGKIAPKLAGAAGAVAPFLQFAQFATNDIRKRNLESWQKQANQLNQSTGMINAGQGIHNQYSAYVKNGGNIPGMEEGGWVSHDWQPQVITQFGEHKVSDLLRPDPMMDTLRTGGHITQNNMFPTDKYALGGELRTTWGGYAEPISHNPYMPGTGETVMFRGKSHEEGDGKGHTGIGVKYGDGGMTDYAEFGSQDADADVEVEKGEPATEMIDPQTGEKNMLVAGNLIMNKQLLPLITHSEYRDLAKNGKTKYKNFWNELSKHENKQNNIIEKSTDSINKNKDTTANGILEDQTNNAKIYGANMKLKRIAQTKIESADMQNATNETAEERGIDADALAKGKIKIDKEAMKQQARFGKEILRYQNSGPNIPVAKDEEHYKEIMDLYEKAKAENAKNPGKKNKYAYELQKKYHEYYPDFAKDVILNARGVTRKAESKGIKSVEQLKKQTDKTILDTNLDEYFGPRTEQYIAKLKKPSTTTSLTTNPLVAKTPTDTVEQKVYTQPKKKYDLMDYVGAVLPYIDDNVYSPDPNINPELMAMSMNQLEGVKAQQVMPLLETPYDISLQDQLNANQADFNATQRALGYNPAALAALDAMKYAANSKVLGEQFRMNQAEKDSVYARNRAALNQAQLQNLSIQDTAYGRQETAKSKTKETAFEAMKSIADKFDKKRLQDQTLAVYRNMFPDYRYTRDLRAVPRGLTLFNSPTVAGASGVPTTATNPYVSANRAAVTAAVAQDPTVLADPNNLSSFIDYSQIPTIEDIYKEETVFPTEQKYGGKTKKDKRNSNLVKAFRNL